MYICVARVAPSPRCPGWAEALAERCRPQAWTRGRVAFNPYTMGQTMVDLVGQPVVGVTRKSGGGRVGLVGWLGLPLCACVWVAGVLLCVGFVVFSGRFEAW